MATPQMEIVTGPEGEPAELTTGEMVLERAYDLADVADVPGAIYLATRPDVPKPIKYVAIGYSVLRGGPWLRKVGAKARRFFGRGGE